MLLSAGRLGANTVACPQQGSDLLAPSSLCAPRGGLNPSHPKILRHMKAVINRFFE
jgi:hypothetical protein